MFKKKPKHVYKTRQLVSVYRRSEKIIITPSSQTTDGVWTQVEPSSLVESMDDELHIGKVLIDALGLSQQGFPHPTDWSKVPEPTLDAAGIGSWRTFMRGSISCTVDRVEGRIGFKPHRNLGVKEGYEPIPSRNFQLVDGSQPNEIGAALLRALELCE